MSGKAIGYLRVSTARQGQSGLGLEAQREAIAKHFAYSSQSLVAEYVEVETGRNKHRPILLQAIAHCKREKATLVISKLDRLARSVAFISALMEAGVEFIALDAPYANRLMLHILAAFGEHERGEISARTKAALAAAKARGVILGAHGKILAEANRREASEFASAVGPKVIEIIRGGHSTLRSIAEQLDNQGILGREGGAWSPMMVSRVLNRLKIDPNGRNFTSYSALSKG